MKGLTTMRRLLWLGLLAALVPARVDAQVLNPSATSITAAGSDCSVSTRCVVITDLRNIATIGVYLNVGTSGTFISEATIDNTNWFAVTDDVNGASSFTADAALFFSNPGYRQFRVRASAISGDASVTVVRGTAGLRSTASLDVGDITIENVGVTSIAAGDNNIGNVDVASLPSVTIGTFPDNEPFNVAQINGVTPLMGAGNTGTGSLRVTVASDQATIPVSLASVPSHAVTNAGTFAVQAAQSGTWTVQPGNTANTTAWLVTGTGGTFPVTDSGGSLTVDGTVTVTDGAGALNVICDSGCSGGTTDADDASIATGQTTGLNLGLTQVYDGSVWRRLTIGTAGTASAQVLTVQGIASMTPFLVAQSGTWDEVGINDSGNSITVDDGGGSLTIDGSISCSNCTGSGASAVDDAAFTIATDSVAPAGFLFDDNTPDSVNEGDVGLARMSANRNQYTTIRDAAGNERGANVNASNQLEVAVGNTVTVSATNLDVQIGGSDSLTIGTFPDNEPINVAQMNGVAVSMGNGASGTGVQRVTIANDSTGVLAVTNAALTELASAINSNILDINISQIGGSSPTADLTFDFDSGGGTQTRAAIGLAFAASGGAVLAPGTTADGLLVNLGANNDVTVTGTATPVAANTGGASSLKYTVDGTNNDDEHAVCTGPCNLYSITATNTAATVAYIRCENDTAANTDPGTDTPELTLAIPGATTGAGITFPFPVGVVFSNALTCWITTGEADTDQTDAGQDDVKIFYSFKQ